MKISSYFLSLFIIFSLYACKHSYYDIEKRELNSGVRNDSIFFDLHFGMTSKEFYDRCWELNKQEVVKEGPSNSSVKYLIKEGLRHDSEMLFYRIFYYEISYNII